MIGKHVVIDTLDNFKAKLDLIPSSAIVLIKDVGQIYAHGTYFGAQKTYSLLTKTADGLAPKGGTSASSLISNVDTEWVLTVTNGENPTWRKLPANAFSSLQYTLTSATTSELGGIKVGQVYTATFNDLVGLYYKVNIDKNGLAYVHVPWVNNPYTASGNGITLKDNVFSLSLNSVTKLDSAIGNKIYAVSLDKNGKLCVSVPWTDTNNIFVGATETKNGSSGMVPAPIANQHNYFLRGDGTWVKPNLSDFTDDIVSGKYLKIQSLHVAESDKLLSTKIWSAGNTSKGDQSTQVECPTKYGMYISLQYSPSKNLGYQFYGDTSETGNLYTRFRQAGELHTTYNDWKQIAFIDSNVESATKLETSRTIWGQPFDGTNNVSGNLTLGNSESICVTDTKGSSASAFALSTANNLLIGRETASMGYITYLYGSVIQFRYGTSRTDGMILNGSGNVTIGSSDLASTSYKLYVNGAMSVNGNFYHTGAQIRKYNDDESYRLTIGYYGDEARIYNIKNADTNVYGSLRLGTTNVNCLFLQYPTFAVGIGTTTPSAKLHVAGDILATKGLTANSTSFVNGQFYITSEGSNALIITANAGNPAIMFKSADTTLGRLTIGEKDGPLYRTNAGWTKSYKIWDEGNDGAGSGLDSDLLDGQEGSWYQNNVIAFSRQGLTNTKEYDANVGTSGMLYNYGSNLYWKNAPEMSYGQILTLRSGGNLDLAGQLAWDVVHGSTTDTTRHLWWRATDSGDWIEAKWHQIAFTDSNVASATKLKTARTIWGQSFDGTANVSGNLLGTYFGIYDVSGNPYLKFLSGSVSTIVQMLSGGTLSLGKTYTHFAITQDGNIGIGTTSPNYKLDIIGSLNATTIYQNGITLDSILSNYLPLTGGTLKNGTARDCLYLDTNGNIGTTLTFQKQGTTISKVGHNSNTAYGTFITNTLSNRALMIGNDGNLWYSNDELALTKSWRVWHSGNDGSDSGLDADLLDGMDSTGFLRYISASSLTNKDLNYANNTYGTWNYGDDSTLKNTPTTSYGCYLSWGNLASSDTSTTRNQVAQIGVDCWSDLGRMYVRARQAGNRDVSSISNWRTVAFLTDTVEGAKKDGSGNTITSTYLTKSSYTASDVLTKLKTVDGENSGLDADLLDGNDSTWYVNCGSTRGSSDYTYAWRKVGTKTITSSSTHDSCTVFLISNFYGKTSGIIEVSYRKEVGATTTSSSYTYLRWITKTSDADTAKVTATASISANTTVLNLYINGNGWTSFRAEVLTDGAWGGRTSTWTMYDSVTYTSGYSSIPSSEYVLPKLDSTYAKSWGGYSLSVSSSSGTDSSTIYFVT